MNLKGLIIALMAAAVLLPVAVTLVVATGFLFAAFNDATGAHALFAIALACGLLWALDLVALLLVLSLDTAARKDAAEPEAGEFDS